jgi:uncharacterized protein YcbK (DUF882 family)
MTDKLSPHFSLHELTATTTGYDNTPSNSVIENLYKLAENLEVVRDILTCPLKINSGFRSVDVNNAVGGSKTSAHCFGLAADFVPQGVSLSTAFDLLSNHPRINYDQLILEQNWLHIGFSNNPRKQTLIFDGKNYHELT